MELYRKYKYFGRKKQNLQLKNKVCGAAEENRPAVPGIPPALHSQAQEKVKKTFN